jgi:hypothetical protein
MTDPQSKTIRTILEELNDYDTKKHPEFIDLALSDISKIIDEAKPDDLLTYPNSDTDWLKEVKGYNTGISDYHSNLKETLR